MKIVILDGYGLNPGDLSWEPLEKLGNVTIYDRTTPQEIIPRAIDAEILLTNKTPLNGETLAALPRLKYVGILATGYNIVDIDTARRLNITVTNIPAYSTESVAQMVFAHLLTIIARVEHYTRENTNSRWSSSPDFVYWDYTMHELAGKTLGIIGFGNIGHAVARIAQAFGMKVITYTSKDPDQLPEGIAKADLDEIFTTSDVLSLHCPLTPATRNLVDARRLSQMKHNAILINTSRGPLIDETALANALNTRQIYAAGLDVLSTEPPRHDNPLLTARNCFITPHIGWATIEARRRLMQIAADNLHAYLSGHPINTLTNA